MTRNLPAILVALIVIVVIACMMCAFQVRFTETVVVTRFDRILENKEYEPGLHFKAPWPIDRVHRFDTRLRVFETEFRQAATRDQKTVILTSYATWRVQDGRKFLESVGSEDVAAPKIRDLLENQVQLVLRRYDLDQLVNTEEDQMKMPQLEKEFLEGVQGEGAAEAGAAAAGVKKAAMDRYGIEIVSVGVKRLGLPESVTKDVFDRMMAERENVARKLRAEGESEARAIRDEAKEVAQKIRARAEAYAKNIVGEGEAMAASYYAYFEKNRELADFLKKLESVETILKSGQITLVIDADKFQPFDLLNPGKQTQALSRIEADRDAALEAAKQDAPAGRTALAEASNQDDEGAASDGE